MAGLAHYTRLDFPYASSCVTPHGVRKHNLAQAEQVYGSQQAVSTAGKIRRWQFLTTAFHWSLIVRKGSPPRHGHRPLYATCVALIVLLLTRLSLLPQYIPAQYIHSAILYCDADGCQTGRASCEKSCATAFANVQSLPMGHFPATMWCNCNWFANCVTKGWQL